MNSPSQFDAPTPESLAALLPAYDFEMLIAKGGMGAVYKARQKSLDRDVAIKILPRELVADPAFRKSFETEARAMARLNHPNLISIYDSGEVDGMPYLVMEFVPGKSLYRSAYGRVIHPEQAVELTLGICRGLGHAHDSGIIHRDIKPANILLNAKAEPKIGDFGLAHPLDGEGSGPSMGTPGYTAPEAMRLPEKGDRRSDLYSVGVILYELLTGTRQEPTSPPPSSVAGVDIDLDSIWRRATNSNPGLRYPDAHAFEADLAAWLKRRPAHGGASPPSTSSLPRKAAPPVRTPAQRQEEAVLPASSGGSGMFVNLLLIAALAGGGYYIWKKMSEPSATPPAQEAVEDSSTGTTPGAGKPGSSALSIVPRNVGNGSGQPSPFGTPSPFGSTSPGGGSSDPGSAGGSNPLSGDSTSSKADGSSDALTVKARELITAAEQERTKALSENIRRFNWDLDTWSHGLSKTDQGIWQPNIDGLKAVQRNSRVPLAVPEGSRVKLSPQMSKMASTAADKQKEIDAAYLAKVTRYHDLYVGKMRDAIAESEKAGQASVARNQRLLLANAATLNAWVRTLGGEAQPENPTLEVHKLDPSDKSTFFGIPLH